MAKTKAVQNKKTGKFEGSIGAGKGAVPIAAPSYSYLGRPVEHSDLLVGLSELLDRKRDPMISSEVPKALNDLNSYVTRYSRTVDDSKAVKTFAHRGFNEIVNRWHAGVTERYGYDLDNWEETTVFTKAVDAPRVAGAGVKILGISAPVTTDWEAAEERYRDFANFARALLRR